MANEGYDTKELLLKKQKEIIRVIDEVLVPGLKTDSSIVVNDNDRMMRRRYLSAIFWVLDDTTQQERTDYYKYFLSQKGDYINVADRVE